MLLDKVNGYNFGRGPFKDYLDQIWLHSILWFWRRFSKISNLSSNKKPWKPFWLWSKVIGQNFGRDLTKEYHI